MLECIFLTIFKFCKEKFLVIFALFWNFKTQMQETTKQFEIWKVFYKSFTKNVYTFIPVNPHQFLKNITVAVPLRAIMDDSQS